jgi:hypothetical protein
MVVNTKSASPPNRSSTGSDGRPRTRRVSGWGLFFKLFGVGAAIWGAAFANRFQEKLTGTTLLSQREQAESQLRAKMFGDLIGPIAGQPGARPLDCERELLLAELLALNFHEHFEFKPLLLHVDDRLSRIPARKLAPQAAKDARHELRSTARRVAGRQISSLLAETGQPQGSVMEASFLGPLRRTEPEGAKVELLRFHGELPAGYLPGFLSDPRGGRFEEDALVLRSPDGADSMRVIAHDPDPQNETVKLDVRVWERNQGPLPTSSVDFEITWFDFPMTDNTLLKDGNRFAFVLHDFQSLPTGQMVVHVRVVWFPRGYFTPRERPVNQRELQELIGRKMG